MVTLQAIALYPRISCLLLVLIDLIILYILAIDHAALPERSFGGFSLITRVRLKYLSLISCRVAGW